jgi:SsrA-binding protein
MKKGKDGAAPGKKIISVNKKARFNYHIIETLEAGIVLTGGEIKSLRVNGISIAESYVSAMNGEVFLLNAHIKAYSFSSDATYDPVRPRKLLLHEHEINKLRGRSEQKGLTVVPLEVYLKNGRAKVEIALAKGKDAPDKRDSIRERETKRELARAMGRKG